MLDMLSSFRGFVCPDLQGVVWCGLRFGLQLDAPGGLDLSGCGAGCAGEFGMVRGEGGVAGFRLALLSFGSGGLENFWQRGSYAGI